MFNTALRVAHMIYPKAKFDIVECLGTLEMFQMCVWVHVFLCMCMHVYVCVCVRVFVCAHMCVCDQRH